MYLNNKLGCCVISGKFHAIGIWSGNETSTIVGTDKEVEDTYRIWNPGTEDNGCELVQVLNYFRDIGITCAGNVHKIDNYLEVDWTNKLEVKLAIYLFGTLDLGILFPRSWLSSAIWKTTRSKIVGGHCVVALGYNDIGVQVSSWGRIFTIEWKAFTSIKWLEEAHLMLSPDWYGKANIAPNGVDLDALKVDLQAFKK